MNQTEYAVFYLDEGGEEFQAGLDLCHGDTLCDECRANPDNIDVCDYQHHWVTDKSIAEERVRQMRQEGTEARVWQRSK